MRRCSSSFFSPASELRLGKAAIASKALTFLTDMKTSDMRWNQQKKCFDCWKCYKYIYKQKFLRDMQNWSNFFHFQIKTKQISFNKRNKNNNIEDDRRSSRGWRRKNVVAAFFFSSSFCVLLSLFDKIKLNSKKSNNSDFVISSRKIWGNPQQDTRLSSILTLFFFLINFYIDFVI